MGSSINPSGDKIPPQKMYDACRVLAQYVDWEGGLSWNFSRLFSEEIPNEFTDLISDYLQDVLKNKSEHKGWKIPETTLIYPWIQRMFPDIKYIHWVRDPRDGILSGHKTDDLRDFGIQYELTDDIRKRRAISWYYQYQLMKATPEPKNLIKIRFEDFVLHQEEVLEKLEDFLGFPLGRIIVRRAPVERWKQDANHQELDFLQNALKENGYQ
ncbi:hypothetical protein CMK19_04190 [Candidatus Poribacteria bacterium]|nr:hypothetical protein [Candidatus Poribacteria bacterium]